MNSNLKIKVCGLTKLNQIEELNSLEIDFLGFIFFEKSTRYVLNFLNLEEIKSIKSDSKVGVFVNETLEKIIEISEKADLNFIQLHGDENQDFILKLKEKLNPKIEIIKVIRIGNQSKEELQKTINGQPTIINYLLFDTDSKAFGGTGKTFDWQILNDLKIEKPYFLSGGISNENVEELKNFVKVNLIENQTLTKLKRQNPFALDINSKFEISPGFKDLQKIRIFKNSF
ncbi:phosphoribosylanthranilate isomerase [Halpernia humi]|uniref:N-(5'-phosphoribosyl)anthranilate isomerase n=1 Tax=Halpernia humi TaxID=493375 RepID=A0A1H6B3R6_9FLAO|nr:phosphoribosylanthranilate isomerase [Halpernia humi]SEG55184.1 phosphoribosylanthranilate isomerase [Halpernia humi]